MWQWIEELKRLRGNFGKSRRHGMNFEKCFIFHKNRINDKWKTEEDIVGWYGIIELIDYNYADMILLSSLIMITIDSYLPKL